jgi:hypothetical protein
VPLPPKTSRQLKRFGSFVRQPVTSSPVYPAFWLVLVALACGCRSSISAVASTGAARPVHDAPVYPLVRVFDVESPTGLTVDAATSGLGFAIDIPKGTSTTATFKVTFRFTPAIDGLPFYLGVSSDDVGTLERPLKVEIPLSMLGGDVAPGEGTGLVVTGTDGVRRLLGSGSLAWKEASVVVTTSQPFGEWTFAALAGTLAAARSLAIAVSGLEPAETLIFKVQFLRQRVLAESYEVRPPDAEVVQEVAGNETRFLVASASGVGDYDVTVGVAPAGKACTVMPAAGPLDVNVQVAITCASE